MNSVRSQLSDDAAAYVRAMITSGQWRPGDTVRPEVVAEALDISATPAREALYTLRVEGFLELLPRRGFRVAALNGDDIRDLFTTHALLAGELAARAAVNASEKDIAGLVELHQELLAAAEAQDLELLERMNHAFHRQLNLIAGSRKIAWVLHIVGRYIPTRFYSSIQGWPQATAEDHASILKALSMRDPDAARAAMCEHVVHSGELLARQFDNRDQRDPQQRTQPE